MYEQFAQGHYLTVEQMRVEPVHSESQVQHPNHYITRSHFALVLGKLTADTAQNAGAVHTDG